MAPDFQLVIDRYRGTFRYKMECIVPSAFKVDLTVLLKK